MKKSYSRRTYLATSPIIRKGFKRLTADCVKIIQVLDENGSLRKGKLMEKTGIKDGTIDRRLNHLRAIGVVRLDKRKYQLTREYEESEFEVSDDFMIKHSLTLIPALEQIARITTSRYATKEGEYISERDMQLFIECAMAHLRRYPDIMQLIDERTKLENAQDNAYAIGLEVEREIREIILKIKSGRPIRGRGRCKICANEV